jgi:cell fate (sporulation/competence/biofilm development) regulator YlbF (YheA/YmcA/DUF963 family)
MDLQLKPISSPTSVKTDPLLAAQTLGNILRQTPEYEAFLKALKAVNTDSTIQQLSAELRAHRTALKWGRDPDGQHTTELTRLELELEDLPAVKEYHRVEEEVSLLFRAVDEIISQAAGVAFAVNAQRSGCSCGG